MSQLPLVDCLKLFNRKERYWLLRNALGAGSTLELPLSMGFLEIVLRKVGISSMPDMKNVWWAMDYHFDWLVGALWLYAKGEDIYDKPIPLTEPNIISGSQEDIDFIIAFDSQIVLIEAKLATSWDSEQFKSKCNRLTSLREIIKELNLNIDIKFVIAADKLTSGIEKCHERENIDVNFINISTPADNITTKHIIY